MNITAPMVSAANFAHAFHWGVSFTDFSADFFPASILSEVSFSFDNGEIQHGPGTYSFPQKAGRGAFTLQIFELTGWDLYHWLVEWRKKLFDSATQTVGLLGHDGVTKKMIRTLNAYDTSATVFDTIYVIPDGEVSYELNSEKTSPVSVSLTLTPVGSYPV